MAKQHNNARSQLTQSSNINNFNQLMFHSTVVQSVKRNNQVWITSSDLARLLEYKSTDSVTKIYSRNKLICY